MNLKMRMIFGIKLLSTKFKGSGICGGLSKVEAQKGIFCVTGAETIAIR